MQTHTGKEKENIRNPRTYTRMYTVIHKNNILTNTYIFIADYTHTETEIHTSIYIYICMHIHTGINTHKQTDVFIYIYIYISI